MNKLYLFLLQILYKVPHILYTEWLHLLLLTTLGSFSHNKKFPNHPTYAVPKDQ